MSKCYDTIIIGAGIAGATAAYTLTQQNQKVLVFDKKGIAFGGSGAAGAFVSPKIGKGSPLQKLTNEAFSFAKDFYLSICPEYFHQTGVIRIPKDEEDAQKFSEYELYNDNVYENYTNQQLKAEGINTNFESFFFPEAGDCDAMAVCEFLLQEIEMLQYEVKELKKENGVWVVGEYSAKNIILATGYESNLADLRYMGIRGTWGSRGDYRSALDLKVSMHKSISVSANIDGIIKTGATHVKSKEPCMICDGKPLKGLFESASQIVDTSDFVLKETFCGMRSGSKDYFPLLGKVIDVPFMLENYPAIVRGAKPEMRHIDHLFVCNGLGGRGFVFAPLLAEWLAESIVNNTEIDKRVNTDRLFLKWCRKL